jgi:regulator of cell morphogenesis and NO signaling
LAELGAIWAGRRGIEMRTVSPIVPPAVAPAATPVDDLASSTVGDIARRSPASIRVFQRHRIDFCCGGKKTVTAAATSAGVEPASLLRELRTAISSPKTGEAWLCALPDSPSELSKAIVGRYHVALRGELPRLAAMADRVVEAHGKAMPQTLPPIAREVRALSEELRSHMREEEEILFPAIARLEAATAAQPASPADLETLLAAREHEHAVAGERLAVLRRLTQGFQPPEWACNTFRALYHGLAELERELHEHIHLENNVLFPRALAQAATGREVVMAERR